MKPTPAGAIFWNEDRITLVSKEASTLVQQFLTVMKMNLDRLRLEYPTELLDDNKRIMVSAMLSAFKYLREEVAGESTISSEHEIRASLEDLPKGIN